MAIGRKEGEAFIEVVADTDRYERDLEKSIARATKAAAKQESFDALLRAMGDAGERSGKNYETRFLRELRRHRPELVRDVEKMAEMAGSGFVEIFTGQVFGGGGGLFGRGGKFGQLLRTVGEDISSTISDLFSPKMLSGVGGFLASVGPLLLLIPTLTALIFGLGNALVGLLGILGAIPALGAGLIATLGPLLIIFQGFGDAVSALVSGDLDKFNEALKHLTPSAAGVVRELKSLMPIFTAIRKSVQEAFFGRITGELTALFAVLKGPLLGGLSNVAFALGGVVAQLLQFARSQRFVQFLANLFSSVADGINRNGPTLVRFFDALTAVANASLPAVSVFLDRLAAGLDKFSAFMQQSVADGSFQDFLDKGFETLQDLVELTGELGGLFIDMFTTTDEGGKTFLEDVTDAIKRLREFFQSPEGQKFINDMLDAAKDLANILGFIADNMAVLTASFFPAIAAVDGLSAAIDKLRDRSSFLSKFTRVFGGLGVQLLPHFAGGGFTSGPSIAGEAGTEAVIPLDDPVRAREIARDPRLADIIGDPNMTVIAIFDGEPFQARIVKTVKESSKATANRLTQRPRMVG